MLVFGALATGTLGAAHVAANSGGVAADSDDFILYDTAGIRLLYNPDGSGTQAAVAFTVFGQTTSLAAADFPSSEFRQSAQPSMGHVTWPSCITT